MGMFFLVKNKFLCCKTYYNIKYILLAGFSFWQQEMYSYASKFLFVKIDLLSWQELPPFDNMDMDWLGTAQPKLVFCNFNNCVFEYFQNSAIFPLHYFIVYTKQTYETNKTQKQTKSRNKIVNKVWQAEPFIQSLDI